MFHKGIVAFTPVVRTYIDQLAQVLSALVGWSKIDQCRNGGNCKKGGSDVNAGPHGDKGCQYLNDKKPENKCNVCGCMKWVVIQKVDWVQLGRGCQKCEGSGSSGQQQECQCSTSGGSGCSTGTECKCAKDGKCCKCCCTGCSGKCKRECSCITEDGIVGRDECNRDSYMSAYPSKPFLTKSSYVESIKIANPPTWGNLSYLPPVKLTNNGGTITYRRHQCARILLGSVCLIWSGITYMYWTGKYTNSSPYWNNHILDGSGLDDGTLSQWLQALGFPRDMLNNSGPQNRLDKVIWDGFMGQLFLGFTHPKDSGASDGNTAKQPYWMNYPGFVHTAHRDSFNKEARVFLNGTSSSTAGEISENDKHKIGALFKLYILSCAYFTGLQKKTPPKADNKTPRTIREILYWLSALPYSQAYKEMLSHAKESLKKVAPDVQGTKTLSFLQTGLKDPITVHEFNLFAHFQAVTQYCPLVLIGIQGGLKSTDKTLEPAIHALYANTECGFTYPTVAIQAYNQVVHYIRALFYQLYFLRKQCAVKVTCGGKWRECRYGNGVLGKGVISWMCLGCNPMEHDRKCRVEKVNGDLKTVLKGKSGEVALKVKELLVTIVEVVVQLGNAQEALERGEKEGIYQSMVIGLVGALGGVVEAVKEVVEKGSTSLGELKGTLEKVIEVVLDVVKKLEEGVKGKMNVLKNGEAQTALTETKEKLEGAKKKLEKEASQVNGELGTAKVKLDELSKKDGSGLLKEMWEALEKLGDSQKSLKDFIDVSDSQHQVDPGTLIDQLAQGLQKWVGWQEGDICCLGQKKEGNVQSKSDGIGRGCPICGVTVNSIPCSCPGCPTVCCRKSTGAGCSCTTTRKCCTAASCTGCQNGFGCCDCASQSDICRTSGCGCYLSAYQRHNGNSKTPPEGQYYWPTISSDSTKVHLLARIFLGSVCLIWSGLSQLGFLTGGSGNNERWKDGILSKESDNLGSFMAAMGYDLERLNGSGPGEYCLGWSCGQDSKQCCSVDE